MEISSKHSQRKVAGRPCDVNTTGETKDVAIAGTMTGLISGKQWTDTLHLEPLGADLLERGE